MLPTHHRAPNPLKSLHHNSASTGQTVPVQVYVDESERRHYLLGVTIVTGPAQPIRAALRARQRPGPAPSPDEEPLLWVSDAVAWAMGAGGDWRRRVEPMIDEVVRLGR
jgi:hypothetical protein